jgi:DNA-binding SARP family transcriptional activator
MAMLSIFLSGSYQVSLSEKHANNFESNKVRALLAYLALESSQPHSRESLATLFWPDKKERRARRNLTQGLYNLRQVIGDHNETSGFLTMPYAWRQVEVDPWREEGRQQLMWLPALSGRRGEALSLYE